MTEQTSFYFGASDETLRAEQAALQSDAGETFTDRELARERAELEEQGFYSGGKVDLTDGGIPALNFQIEGVLTKEQARQLAERVRHVVNDNTKPSYPDGNPKTAMGAKKPDTSVVPSIAIMHLATAMMNGAEKYGPYNWRDAAVSARVYIAAADRHLKSFLDGENFSADTVAAGRPVHHLAHVMACCAILLDAESVGMLNDNRPTVPGKTGELIEHYIKHGHLGAA